MEAFSKEDEGEVPKAAEEEDGPVERWLEGRASEVLAAPFFVLSLPVLKSESRGAKQLKGTSSSDRRESMVRFLMRFQAERGDGSRKERCEQGSNGFG